MSGYGITDGVNVSDVVTTATANKLLKLDLNSKLPASITGNADGNAGTATKLATARSIAMTGDVTWSITSFDGSANVTAAATLANSGVTAGTYAKVTVDAKGRVTAGASLAAADIPSLDWSKIATGKPTTLSGFGITDGVNVSDVASVAAAGKILKLDVNSKLPASITGNADGNAATATTANTAAKLTTARTITLTGDVTGSVSFDGSGNVSMATTLSAAGTVVDGGVY